jgi:hypothetical protein
LGGPYYEIVKNIIRNKIEVSDGNIRSFNCGSNIENNMIKDSYEEVMQLMMES